MIAGRLTPFSIFISLLNTAPTLQSVFLISCILV
nr:MAG TPA: hypothetical protein [Caudoviricetes sp.]